MIKRLKSNKIISCLLIIMCLIIIINPITYANACLDAISVWSFKVLPLLFPFFLLTKIIVNLNEPKPNLMDRLFNKLYNTPIGSFNTFFLASLAGYPTGAKLICEMHKNKQITSTQASKMMSFCSVSGPMFMLGTVGIMMLNSYKAGIIILISNILASLINGFIFRGKKENTQQITTKTNQNSLADCVYDALISILMVGAYIVLSFLIIELLENLKIISFLSASICRVFNCLNHQNVVQAILCGIIEITGGIASLSSTNIGLISKTIIAGGLIGFGGLSIMMQSQNFLTKLKIPFNIMLKQKITQCIFAILFSTLLGLIFL